MGNIMSQEACFSLSDLPAETLAKIVGEDYTVLRTDGRKETGWKITTAPHGTPLICGPSYQGWHDGVGSRIVAGNDGILVLRIMMSNGFCCDDKKFALFSEYLSNQGEDKGTSSHKHACGWRAFSKDRRGFWPTRLESSEEEKEAWFLWMDSQLDTLKSEVEKKE